MNEVEIRKIVDDEIARVSNDPSKIKYRNASVLATIKNYNKRMKKLEKSLEEAKNDIKNFKYGPGESNHAGSFLGSYADVRLNRAVNRVARLEAEIIDLTGGIKPDDYINSRAIKLKDIMMKNFLVNTRTGYAQLAKEAYDKMFNEKEEEETYEEEKTKLENRASELEDGTRESIEEKIAAANANVETETEVDVNEVDNEEIQDSVDEKFDEEAKSQAISEAFEEEYEDEDYEEEIPITPIENIQPRKMSSVTPATAVKGINDDIFAEERDVPVVAEEREEIDYKKIALKDFICLASYKLQIEATKDPEMKANVQRKLDMYQKELDEVQEHLNDDDIYDIVQLLPSEVLQQIEVVPKEEEKAIEYEEEPTEKIETTEEVVEQPVEVEEKVVNKDTGATEIGTAESIKAVKILHKENQWLEEKEAQVREEQENIAAKYEEAKRQLLATKKYLEESATAKLEQINKIEKENAQRAAELNAIFSAMDDGPKDNNSEKKK